MVIKQLDFSIKSFKIQLCYINNRKLLLFTNKSLVKYYKQIIPFKVYKTCKNSVILYSLWGFLKNFMIFYRNLIFKAKGFLVLKGLGLKVSLRNNVLELKLGYSHQLFLNVPQEIFVKVQKNLLFLQSVNKEKLGNFLYKIKILRKPDVYKGKGIWYKNEKIVLKTIKKK